MTDTNAPLRRSSRTAKPRVRADQTAPKLPLPTAATAEGSSTEAAAATDGEATTAKKITKRKPAKNATKNATAKPKGKQKSKVKGKATGNDKVPRHNEPEVIDELQVIKANNGEPALPQLRPDVTDEEVRRLLVEYGRAVYDWFEWNATEDSNDVRIRFRLVNDEYPLPWDKRHPWDEYCPAMMPAEDLRVLYKCLHEDQSDEMEETYQFLVLDPKEMRPTMKAAMSDSLQDIYKSLIAFANNVYMWLKDDCSIKMVHALLRLRARGQDVNSEDFNCGSMSEEQLRALYACLLEDHKALEYALPVEKATIPRPPPPAAAKGPALCATPAAPGMTKAPPPSPPAAATKAAGPRAVPAAAPPPPPAAAMKAPIPRAAPKGPTRSSFAPAAANDDDSSDESVYADNANPSDSESEPEAAPSKTKGKKKQRIGSNDDAETAPVLLKGRSKGKGKATEDHDDSDDDDDDHKSGPLTDEVREEAMACKAAYEAQLADLAKRSGKSVESLHCVIGDDVKIMRNTNMWNTFQAYFHAHFPKEEDENYEAMFAGMSEEDKDDPTQRREVMKMKEVLDWYATQTMLTLNNNKKKGRGCVQMGKELTPFIQMSTAVRNKSGYQVCGFAVNADYNNATLWGGTPEWFALVAKFPSDMNTILKNLSAMLRKWCLVNEAARIDRYSDVVLGAAGAPLWKEMKWSQWAKIACAHHLHIEYWPNELKTHVPGKGFKIGAIKGDAMVGLKILSEGFEKQAKGEEVEGAVEIVAWTEDKEEMEDASEVPIVVAADDTPLAWVRDAPEFLWAVSKKKSKSARQLKTKPHKADDNDDNDDNDNDDNDDNDGNDNDVDIDNNNNDVDSADDNQHDQLSAETDTTAIPSHQGTEGCARMPFKSVLVRRLSAELRGVLPNSSPVPRPPKRSSGSELPQNAKRARFEVPEPAEIPHRGGGSTAGPSRPPGGVNLAPKNRPLHEVMGITVSGRYKDVIAKDGGSCWVAFSNGRGDSSKTFSAAGIRNYFEAPLNNGIAANQLIYMGDAWWPMPANHAALIAPGEEGRCLRRLREVELVD
ncbi:hypothetical protein C8J57DRAFT_1515580 [Mycena rebaudengoi]|nr:hypothetical protein C8J57DRAFT_1515580 [Mycena rebaudengoi]